MAQTEAHIAVQHSVRLSSSPVAQIEINATGRSGGAHLSLEYKETHNHIFMNPDIMG